MKLGLKFLIRICQEFPLLFFKINPRLLVFCCCFTTPNVFDELSTIQSLTPEERAKALDWINQPGVNQCNGYYLEPDLNQQAASPTQTIETATTSITADAAPELREQGLSTLSGNVVLSQPGHLIQAQTATIDRDLSTKKIKTIDFYGHVIARAPNEIAVGDHAHLQLDQNQANYDDVIYRMGLSQNLLPATLESNGEYRTHGLIAQGQAAELQQKGKNNYVLKEVTYSTCSPSNVSWHLRAKNINLDKTKGRGTAHNAVLYVKSIPVAYSPFLSFPLDNRRYSGFLAPIIGNSTEGGNYLGLPYYWNIAPNYDMTITPSVYSKRALLFTTENRFLTPIQEGKSNFGILPHDQAFINFQNSAPSEYASNYNPYTAPELARLESDSSTRWYYSLKDNVNFNKNWHGEVDYTYVNDDYLQQDIGNIPSAMTGQLLEKASLSYSAPYWNSSLLIQKYQTLHPVTLLQNNNQYARLPDLTFNVNYPQNNHIFYLLNSEAVNFNGQLNPGQVYDSNNGQVTSGARTNIQPGILTPWSNSFAYIRPELQWQLTEYNLSNQIDNYANNITRSLPIFDIDTGLYFDRSTHVFGTEYNQTLEPRLFYLRVPYRSQYQIPVFDTAIQNFTFDQLFQTNRFNGLDRTGDANQLSFALTSRILDNQSGAEKSQFGLGRIYYADNRQVQLCNQPNCLDSQTAVGATSSTERLSPLVGFFNYALNKNWSINSNASWDPPTHEVNNATVNLQFMPAVNHIVNLNYNYVEYGDPYTPPTPSPTSSENNLNQIGASAAWPLTPHMDGLAAWNYNISHQHFQSYLYGASYNGCCYAVRFALSRTFYSLNGNGSAQFNNQFLIQFILKGLGGVGQQSAFSSLSSSIPGYQETLTQGIY